MNSVKVSVIVPVYNVSRYLENCVNSITDQDFTDFEIILVDDCSPDNSGEICDRLAKEDGRIRVIHKEKNGGLGEARKTGMQYACGEWTVFADSDDWLEPNTFSRLLNAVGEETDIVIFGVNFRYEDKRGEEKYTVSVKPERAVCSTAEEIGSLIAELDGRALFPYMWNKLYRTDFLKSSGVEFNSIQSMEDFFFNIELIPKAKSVAALDCALYNYRKPSHETLVSAYNPNFFALSKKRYLSEKECIEALGAATAENMQLLYKIYIKHVISCGIREFSKKARLTRRQRKNNFKIYLNDGLTKDVAEKYNPTSSKMKIIKKIFAGEHTVLYACLCRAVSFAQNKLGTVYNRILKK